MRAVEALPPNEADQNYSVLRSVVESSAQSLASAVGSTTEVHRLLSGVPDIALQRSYLELRLGTPSDALDLGLGFSKHGAIRNLEGCQHLATWLERRPAWGPVANYLARWTASPKALAIRRVWVGLDGAKDNQHGGGVVYLDQGARSAQDMSRDQEAAESWRVFEDAVHASKMDDEALVRLVVSRAPPKARVQLLGAHIGRGTGALKLCQAYLCHADIPNYLGSIGWAGSQRMLSDALSAAPWPERFHPGPALTHILLAGGVVPRLDLEYKCHDADQETGGLREQPLLRRLATLGLCTTSAAAAVLNWPGVVRIRSTPWQLHRTVNSIKLVLDDNGPSVKAYLNFAFIRVTA